MCAYACAHYSCVHDADYRVGIVSDNCFGFGKQESNEARRIIYTHIMLSSRDQIYAVLLVLVTPWTTTPRIASHCEKEWMGGWWWGVRKSDLSTTTVF